MNKKNKHHHDLKRALGSVEIFSISSGAMISSGIFVLPAVIFKMVGPSTLLAYILAAFLVIPAMLSQMELSTAMPKSGGAYFFVHRSLGPLFGTFAGFANWFSIALKSAFALVGIGIFLTPLFPTSEFTVRTIALVFTLIFFLLNLCGAKKSGIFQVGMVFFLILLLSIYILFGFEHVKVNRFEPFRITGWKDILTATGMIFISFGGLTKIASVAEEVHDPSRDIPKAMFSSFLIVSLLYILAVFVTIGVLDQSVLEKSLTPLSSGANFFLGKSGFIALSIAGILAFVTTANAGILSASRIPLAMARDGLLPSLFSRVSEKRGAPTVALLATSAFMAFVISLLSLEVLVKVASTMMLILFTLVNISVILMRESGIHSYQPFFRSPLYPFSQIIGSLIYTFLIFEMGFVPLLLTALFFILSTLWYVVYSRRVETRKSAFLHVVERITSKKMRSANLPNELREILLKRDRLVEDRFDRLIKESVIMDIDEELDIKGLFSLLSKTLSNRIKTDSNTIFNLLMEREQETTTVVMPGLAIPHIVVEGEHQFDIVVVRSRKGITFSPDKKKVNVVFTLAGTMDERNFHLKCLMSIAQIVNNRKFLETWLSVRNTEELRNVIILGRRTIRKRL